MKLLEFQKKVEPIIKDSTNPFYKSKYADINSLLDVIKPLANELGLTIIQPLGVEDGKNILETRIYNDKEIIASSKIILPDIQDPQKIGSAITYYRRYSLQSLLLLQAEDDDGERAKKLKSRDYTAEANECDTVDQLNAWIKTVPKKDVEKAKSVGKQRKSEVTV